MYIWVFFEKYGLLQWALEIVCAFFTLQYVRKKEENEVRRVMITINLQ